MRRYGHLPPARASSPAQLISPARSEEGAVLQHTQPQSCRLRLTGQQDGQCSAACSPPPWGSFQMGAGQGAAGTPLQLLEMSWLPMLSGAAAAASVRAKLSCCRQGKWSYMGLQVLHTDGLAFCGFCKVPAEVGTEACSGQGRACCLHRDAKALPTEGSKCKLIPVKCANWLWTHVVATAPQQYRTVCLFI